MLDTFLITTFAEGDTLKVFYGDEQFVSLSINRISKGKHKYPSDYREPFSLLLVGSQEIFLPQNTYKVEHDRLGTFEVFIVPTMPFLQEKESNVYQIDFS